MTDAIKQRIEQIKKGAVPQGYQQTRAGIAPNDWVKGRLSDILYNEKRTVTKPQDSYWRIGIKSHAKGTFHEYVDNPDAVGMDELYVVKKDDLIVNITFAWEHAIALADENDNGLLVSHRFPTYVFKKDKIPYFYKTFFLQNRFKELLALISPGGAGRNRVMSKKDFLQLPCFIPCLKEQQKIAEILMQCDKIIELYEQEIEKLKKLKKAYLRKMFPKKGENVPELRFAGFTDPWEQRKVGEITTVHPFKPYLAEPTLDGKIEVIQQGNVPILGYANGTPFIDYEKITLFGDHTVSVYKPKCPFFVASDGLKILSAKGIEGNFFYYLLECYKPISEGYKRHFTILKEKDCLYPANKSEQKKISAFLTRLDNLITLHQRKLEEQQKQKKSLMQLLLTGIVRVKI